MNVCVGGTFYPLHNGHKTLLRKAFEVAGPEGSVFIGLTTLDMIKKKGKIASFQKRKHLILQFLSEEKVPPLATIQPLFDKFGPTLEGDFDAIVVSPETEQTAEEINRRRTSLGKTPMKIIMIPYVLAEDGKPISSSRIRRKEIDEKGSMREEE